MYLLQSPLRSSLRGEPDSHFVDAVGIDSMDLRLYTRHFLVGAFGLDDFFFVVAAVSWRYRLDVPQYASDI
jgi:hypothetical protein